MSKERELLKTALGILEDYEWGYGGDHHKSPEASILNDIRKLLAQPEQTEQEPVAWMVEWVQRYRHNDTPIMDRAVSFTKGDAPAVPNPNYIPLYTSPPTREPLSLEELCKLYGDNVVEDIFTFARAIEKAHGIGGGE